MDKCLKLLNEIKSQPESFTDSQKLSVLGSLLTLNNNLKILRQIQRNSEISSRPGGNPVDRSGSIVISHAIGLKSSRSFSFFSKKKICKV
jgi:hypothetical protein